MGDFTADKNQLSEKKTSVFDSFKFWGHRPRHRDSLSVDIEKSPTIPIEDTATNHTPKENRDASGQQITQKDESTKHTPEEKRDATDQQNAQKDESTKHTPEEKSYQTNPSSVKLSETISGNHIITRGWDGNNMEVYKTRRRNY